MISEEHLQKFKNLYKKHFNEELSDQDALEQATKLTNLVKLIYKPMTEEEYKKVEEEIKEIENEAKKEGKTKENKSGLQSDQGYTKRGEE